jgi:NOL1/NOP2/sun family putative RNA methylase
VSGRLERKALQISQQTGANLDIVSDLLQLLSFEETLRLLRMKKSELKTTARVNLLKITRSEVIRLLNREGIKAKPIEEIPEAIHITKGGNKLGNSQTYLKGMIMPQGLGSMYAVHALDPQPGELILDMAAAPGGKSCFIAERMQLEGTLISNDISWRRLKALFYNLSRHGITNAIVSHGDAQNLSGIEPDRIMLDAPCTGTGLLVAKDHIKTSKSIQDSIQLQRLQINLLNTAYTLLSPGGTLIYATCALSEIENEMVIENFQRKFTMEDPAIEGIPALVQDRKVGRRFYPHIHGSDGFFISRMVKK